MDINEFKKQNKPKGHRSKLTAFRTEILDLKKAGYAEHQICSWLKTQGLEISRPGLRKFISLQTQLKTKSAPEAASTPGQNSDEEQTPKPKTKTPPTPPGGGSSNPRDLDAIFSGTPDTYALEQQWKNRKK